MWMTGTAKVVEPQLVIHHKQDVHGFVCHGIEPFMLGVTMAGAAAKVKGLGTLARRGGLFFAKQ